MQASQIIQSQARVITIIDLVEGDTYKLVKKKSYSQDYDLYVGVVTGVMHNGETAVFTALELKADFSGDAQIVVHGGEEDLMIYPATPAELVYALDYAKSATERKIKDALQAKDKALELLEVINTAFSSSTQLTVPATSTTEAIQA